MKTGKHQRSKRRFQDLCWKVHDCVRSRLCFAHTLCMNCVTDTFLLASSSGSRKQLLCFVQGQGQNRNEQKQSRKNSVGFHNNCPLLIMSRLCRI